MICLNYKFDQIAAMSQGKLCMFALTMIVLVAAVAAAPQHIQIAKRSFSETLVSSYPLFVYFNYGQKQKYSPGKFPLSCYLAPVIELPSKTGKNPSKSNYIIKISKFWRNINGRITTGNV